MRRSKASRRCSRAQASTASRASLPRSEASRQSVTLTISSHEPGAWKPQISSPDGSVPKEYSSLLR